MENYHESKRARRVASVIYLLFLGFIVGGTLLAQKEPHETIKQEKNQ
jgi:hypothetical protein